MAKVRHSHHAPAAIGPYSQAIELENLIFVSGQLPLDPKTMKIEGATAAEQTEQLMENIKAILAVCDKHLENVVKTTIFLTNLDDFEAVNQVYGRYFSKNPPARSCVEVSRLPKGALVEIECIVGKF